MSNESFAERLKRLSPEQRASLQARLGIKEAIKPCSRQSGSPLPLSAAQERMWFLHRLDRTNATYNCPWAVRLLGALDVEALSRSIDAFVARHEVLHTTYEDVGGRPSPRLEPLQSGIMTLEDASAAATGDDNAIVAAAIEDGQRPFDLEHGPVFRARLLRRSEVDHTLLINIHHIATDGGSFEIMLRELARGYQSSSVFAPPIQYVDYAAWERANSAREEPRRAGLAYWKQKLESVTPLDLPTDWQRPPRRTNEGALCSFHLGPEVSEALRELTRAESTTLFLTGLACFEVLLARYTRQTDIVIGTPVAKRPRPELESLVGLFVNTVVLRTDLSGAPSLREILRRVRRTVVEAQDHANVPFEAVVSALGVERDPSRNPLFDVAYVQATVPRFELGPGIATEPLVVDLGRSTFDLAMCLWDRVGEGDLHGQIEYRTDLWEKRSIDQLAKLFVRVVEAVVREPDQPINRLSLLSETDRTHLLIDWNRSETPGFTRSCLHDLVIEQAKRTPDRIALTDTTAETETTSLHYRDLDERSHALAEVLVSSAGVGEGDVVGLLVPRSSEAVVAMLAVLRAGAAYMPLDPTQPEERLRAMFEDAGVKAIITSVDPSSGDVSSYKAPVISLRSATLPIRPSHEVRLPRACGADIAYIIYTSGSTGQPKGVAIAHETITRFVREQTVGGGRPEQRRATFASVAFDAHAWEIWPALIFGGSAHFVPDSIRANPAELIAWLTRERIDWAWLPAHVAEQCWHHDWPADCVLKIMGTGADRVHAVPRRQFPFQIQNAYGPTECTILATAATVSPGDPRPSIGRPFGGARVYVLDENLELAAIGQPAELFIGGSMVGRGYVRRAALTAEKFLPDPFAPLDEGTGARMYRTGDLVRWNVDGQLEYLGRIDHQVKVRGFRIEIGEIESVLGALPNVKNAVVIVQGEGLDRQLIAYVLRSSADAVLSADQILDSVRKKLPQFMVPATVVILDKLPLTSSGKVDRRALPKADLSSMGGVYVAPRNDLEESICRIFLECLKGVTQVGVDDDFFRLGGHSLKATEVVARLRKQLDIDVPLSDFFEAPTVAKLAELIQDRIDSKPKTTEEGVGTLVVRAPRDGHLPVTLEESRLWFVDHLTPGDSGYNMTNAFRLRSGGSGSKEANPLDIAILEEALNELVCRHESLRTRYELDAESGQLARRIDAPSAAISLGVTDTSSDDIGPWIDSEVARPYDLAKGPLFRAQLARIDHDDHDHVLVLEMHHIISDGWSWAVLLDELAELCASKQDGRPPRLAPMPVQYADYAAQRSRVLTEDHVKREVDYWTDRLRGVTPLELAPDHAAAAHSQRSAMLDLVIADSGLLSELRAVLKGTGITLFMLTSAAFGLMLGRLTGHRRFAIGFPIANRTRTELEPIIGLFMSAAVLPVDLSGDPTIEELLRRAHRASLDAYAHVDVPFEKLVDILRPGHEAGASALKVWFALQNIEVRKLALPDTIVTPISIELKSVRHELSLGVSEQGLNGPLVASFDYRADLFDRSTIERMAQHLRRLLEGFARSPLATTRAFDLPMLGDEEAQRLATFSRSNVRHERNVTTPLLLPPVHEQFEARARETPDAIAVVFVGDEKNERVTYRDLNSRANRIARVLQRHRSVGSETPIATLFHRSIDMIAAVLAVLKIGATYVPLDPANPAARIVAILKDAGAAIVLSSRAVASDFTETAADVPSSVMMICIDVDDDDARTDVDREPDHDLCIPSPPDGGNAAYAIYTSGTTGQPKGVVVEHRSLSNIVAVQTNVTHLTNADRVSQVASPAFDAAMNEIWPALTAGAALYIVDDDTRRSPKELTEWFTKHRITVADLPTALIDAGILTEDWSKSAMRVLTIGGSALRDRPRGDEKFRLVNQYGPTETTVWVTGEDVEPGTHPTSTIGKPIENSSVYIVDPRGDLAPIGVFGEIQIGGLPVARGYLGRPALTAERFVPDPFGQAPNGRLYRTGDRGRWLADGRIEFGGRVDEHAQVKLRGFRIELAEIESVIRSCDLVQDAVVVLRGDGLEQRLVGYATPLQRRTTSEQSPLLEAIRKHAREHLPEYMVPTAIVLLDQLPLTSNGKIDRAALPIPELTSTTTSFEAPRGSMEETLAEVFRSVLRVNRVGRQDDFFSLGGHSLLAIQAIALINQKLDVQLPFAQFLKSATVERVAAACVSGGLAGTTTSIPALSPPNTDSAPLSYPQRTVWGYERSNPNTNAWSVSLGFLLTPVRLSDVVNAVRILVERHDAFRTRIEVPPDDPDAPIQRVVSADEVPIEVDDLTTQQQDHSSALAEARTRMEQRAALPIALPGVVSRFYLARVADNEVVVLCNIHHIACDGAATVVIEQELRALCQDPNAVLPTLPCRQIDFAAWHREQVELMSVRSSARVDAWRQEVQSIPPVDLPPRVSGDLRPSIAGLSFTREQSSGLTALATKENATRFQVFLAMYAALMHGLTGQSEIAIIAPYMGNRFLAPDLQRVVGHFLNHLIFRVPIDASLPFQVLVRNAKTAVLDAYAHGDIPVQLALGTDRPFDHALAQVNINYTPFEEVAEEAKESTDAEPRVELRWLAPFPQSMKVDLGFVIFETSDGSASMRLVAARRRFSEDVLKRLSERFNALMAHALRHPERRVIDLLAQAERIINQ